MIKIESITKRKGFSLVETLITLAIFGILIAMISQVILINLEVSQKVSARTRIREELSEITSLIQRDIRNATVIGDCGPINVSGQVRAKCIIEHSESFYWTNDCPNNSTKNMRICKIDSTTGAILFESSNLLTFENVSFEIILTNSSTTVDGTKSTIVVTLLASSANPNFEVNNQVRQVTVSTRNFTIDEEFVDPEL